MKDLVWYFFKLGSFGFGGPAALVGYMRRDLVEDRRLIDESTYNLSIALAQITHVRYMCKMLRATRPRQ